MKDPDPFNQKISNQLEQIEVTPEIEKRLDKARRNALNSAYPAVPRPLRMYQLRPALAFASVAALALTVMLLVGPPEVELPVAEVDSLEIITAEDDLELYKELEFYWWLEQELESQQG